MSHGAGGYINGVVSDNKTPSPSQPPVHVPKRKPVHRKPVGVDSNSTTPSASPNPQTGSPLLGPPIIPYGAASATGTPSAAPGTPPAAAKKQYRYSSLLDPEPTSPKPATSERRAVSEARKVPPLQTTSAGGLSGAINFSKPVSPASQHAQQGVGFGRAQASQSSTAQPPPSLPPKVPVTSTHNPYSGTPELKQASFGYQASQFASPAAAPYATNGTSPKQHDSTSRNYSASSRPPVPNTSYSTPVAPSTPKNNGPGGNVPGGSAHGSTSASSQQSPPYPVPANTSSYGSASNTTRQPSAASTTTSSSKSTLPYPVPTPAATKPTPQTPPVQSAYKFDSPQVEVKPVAKPAVSKPAMPPIPKTTINTCPPAMPPVPKTNIQKPIPTPAPVAPAVTKAPVPAPASAPTPAAAPIYQPSHHLPPRSPSPDSDYQHSPPRRTLRVVNDFSSSSDEDEPTPAKAAPPVPTVTKTPAGPREYPLTNRMSHLEINDGNHLDPFTPAAPLRIHKKSNSSTSNPSFDFATRESFYATPSGSTDDISQEYVTNESYLNSQRGGVDNNNRSMSSMFTGNHSYDSGSSHSTRPMSGEDLLAGHHLQPQYTHESAIDPFDPSFDPHNPAYEPRTSYEHPEPPSPQTPAIPEGVAFDGSAFGGGAVIGGSVAPVLLDPSINIPDPTEYGAFDVGAPLVPSVTNMSTGTATSMPGLRGAPSIISTTSQVSQKGRISNSDYPALGVESQYVRALRKRTASAWCEVPSKVWGLPLGISDKAGKKFNKNMDMRYAAGLKRTMDIRHSHLKPRLLASEVDDDDGKRSSSHTDMPSSMHAPSIHSMSRFDNRSIISHDDDVDGRSSVSLVSAPQESTPPPAVPASRGRAASDSSQESVQEVRRIHLFVANPDSD
ncbi:hypothetical protein B0I73DRAFT_130560 [Yarrowia lipolytica]|nr:Hypothetical protein YALI2_F00590g [Yarrowia lipolytica]RDW40344.1 hypothetical protein B0I73DRAFT_130560 [Yarrowia lipolytica]SEI31911.1 YALIA101S02e04962g1_1 [Yarrowia lipolytica]VBB82717.1 Hypothetical protein conserved in the Yarrowia clade [Yarrowia lipolytica]